jgi:hypothetical protein
MKDGTWSADYTGEPLFSIVLSMKKPANVIPKERIRQSIKE